MFHVGSGPAGAMLFEHEFNRLVPSNIAMAKIRIPSDCLTSRRYFELQTHDEKD
jgi:hypothetical protein